MRYWPKFYEALANAMQGLSGHLLYQKVKTLASGNPAFDYFHFDNDALWTERNHSIDPFTVLGIFNRGQTDAHRAALASLVADMLDVNLPAPNCYHGIPHLDPRKSIYDDPACMWQLFAAALSGPDETFASKWDKAIAVHGNGLGTLSIGLFWIRPESYMAVDRIADPWIQEHFGLIAPQEKCSGNIYCDFLVQLKSACARAGLTYPDLTWQAWQARHPGAECQ